MPCLSNTTVNRHASVPAWTNERTNTVASPAKHQAMQARCRLTKRLGPILCRQERNSDLRPSQGRNQREKQEQQALVCLFVSLPMLIRMPVSLHWHALPARVWKVDRGIFLAVAVAIGHRTGDSQPQQPMSFLRKGKGDSSRVGTRKWTEMCAPGSATCW